MHRSLAAVMALLAVLLVGCHLFQAPESQPATPSAPPQAVTEDAVRFIAVVGSVTGQADQEAGVGQADALARKRLADAVAGYVSEALAGYLASSPDLPDPSSPLIGEFSKTLAAEVSAAVLRRAMQQESWQGPQGEWHVFYRLPVVLIHDEMQSRMRAALAQANPLGLEPARAVAQMQDFLERRLAERLKEAARARPESPQTPSEHRVPEWLELGRHDRYAQDRYLSAIGVGASPEDAERNGRADLVGYVQHALADLMGRLSKAEPADALAANARALGCAPPEFKEEQLPPAYPAERWHDVVTDTHYALTVLDRAAAGIVYRQGISRAAERYGAASASARNCEKAESYAAALKDRVDALLAAYDAYGLQLQALAIVPPAEADELRTIVPEPILAQARDALQSLLAMMRLEKAGGDNQWTAPGVPPREPVQVRLIAGERHKPVPGVPLRLAVDPQDPSADLAAFTDQNGAARWQIRDALPARAPTHKSVVQLDLGQLGLRAELAALTVPAAAFNFIIRSRSNTAFAVCAIEEAPAGPTPSFTLGEGLRQALSKEGLSLVEDSELLKQATGRALTAERSEPAVLTAFSGLRASMEGDRFLVVIFATMRTDVAETVQTSTGELDIVHCPYSIWALDPDLPEGIRTMLRLSGTGKGAYAGNRVEAIRRAQADAASAAGTQLVAALGPKFRRAEVP